LLALNNAAFEVETWLIGKNVAGLDACLHLVFIRISIA